MTFPSPEKGQQKRNAFIIGERKIKKKFLYVCAGSFCSPILRLQNILIISFEDKSGMEKAQYEPKKEADSLENLDSEKHKGLSACEGNNAPNKTIKW